ncbi:MAG: bifunctional adenosylcobinamide kinase/adenosylcobinamide-phosphate guanylyltransferase [Eubacterium sp.]
MHYFISGGAKSGKSMRAQEIAQKTAEKKHVPLYYLAVMDPQDEEDLERIRGHRKAREGWGFQTLEEPYDVLRALENADARGVFLLDSVTALLANVMFRGGRIDRRAGNNVIQQLLEFADRTENTIFVSDNVFSDAQLYDPLTEDYRRALGKIGIALAERCGAVEEVSAGIVKVWKV